MYSFKPSSQDCLIQLEKDMYGDLNILEKGLDKRNVNLNSLLGSLVILKTQNDSKNYEFKKGKNKAINIIDNETLKRDTGRKYEYPNMNNGMIIQWSIILKIHFSLTPYEMEKEDNSRGKEA